MWAVSFDLANCDSERFSFGTGKVSVLGGYTSAIALGIVALLMLVESVHRLFNPQAIQFNEAIIVACIGLTVNVVSMFLLGDHHHDHAHQEPQFQLPPGEAFVRKENQTGSASAVLATASRT